MQHGWATVAAAVAAVALLAGCAGPALPPSPSPPAPTSPWFEARPATGDRFYAFHHAGGPLAFLPDGPTAADVDLFDGADRRVGAFEVRTQGEGAAVRLGDLPAGEYVARVRLESGDLRIDSAGTAPALRPLPAHVERVVLAEAPAELASIPLLPERTQRHLVIDLERTPASLRLLADGSHSFLRLTLEGAGGPVLEAESFGTTPIVPLPCSLCEVPATVHAEAARDGHLEGDLEADDLQGSLVLESASYSRAAPPGQAGVSVLGDLADRPAFSYGRLPPQPVAFQAPAGTHHLAFWMEEAPAATAWVAVFDAHDRKVATVPVPHSRTVGLRVTGPGAFVAVALSGEVQMGADAAPSDPALAPLQVLRRVVPDAPPAGEGGYGQENATVDVPRLYDVRPADIEGGAGPFQPIVTCDAGGTVRVRQGGETLGAWGSGESSSPWFGPFPPVGAFLGDGPVTVWTYGLESSGCRHEGAELRSYQR